MSIDRQSRNQLADAIRALASGAISNDEFEDKRVPRSGGDAAILEIFSEGAWRLYSDLKEYRLRGPNKLDAKTKKEIARRVLFLKTDLPYEWPVSSTRDSLFRFFANLLTLGAANRLNRKRLARQGDVEVWPFLRRSDLEQALKSPVYLNAP
jgi:hypothetical protein